MQDIVRTVDKPPPGAMRFATATDPGYLPFLAVLASTLSRHRAGAAGLVVGAARQQLRGRVR